MSDQMTRPIVWKHYGKHLSFVFLNIFVSYLISPLLPRITFSHWIGIVGVGIVLTTTVGRLGWGQIDTWGSNTPPEILNRRVYFLFTHLGTFLIFLSVFLS